MGLFGIGSNLPKDGTTNGSTECNKNINLPTAQSAVAQGHTPVWEAPVNDNDDLPTRELLLGANMQKTNSVSSFPRSPSSVSRGYLSLTTVHSPAKLSCESNNQSPKSAGFFTGRRSTRKPLLVRSEVSI